MLILLPPSEGKSRPTRGKPLDLASLAFPEATRLREELLDELAALSSQANALDILKVGDSIAGEVAAQIDIRTAPTARAEDIYTGVLYQALDLHSLDARGRRRASSMVLISSALFGMTTPACRIPPYRLHMDTPLPGGAPAKRWRQFAEAFDERANGHLVLDGRSGAYRDWKPPVDTVTVGAVRHTVTRGAVKRTVISHTAKYYRGLVARLVLESPTLPRDAEQIADLAAGLIGSPAAGGGTITGVELDPPPQRGHSRSLTLVVEP